MIKKVSELVGYQFQDEAIITEALTHASIAGHRLESNERLEFLGDAILGFVVSEYICRQYPELLEGELTKIKSAVVSRKSCAKVSQKLNLHTMLNMGKGMVNRPGLPSSIAAAVFEATIAAIYLDGGMEPAKAFILRHMTPLIEQAAESTHQHNFKSVLQQYAQRHLPSNPQYLLLDEKGPDHSKAFEVCVEVNGQRFESAWANSKKEAEQKAALLALRQLNVLDEDDHGQFVVRDGLFERKKASG